MSVVQSWSHVPLCDPVDCSTPGFPLLDHLLELAQTPVHWVSDAIQPSHPLSPPSPPAFNLSQHQGLFQWIGSSQQVANVLELQLQHQFFHWLFSVTSYYLYLVWYHGPLKGTHTHTTERSEISYSDNMLINPTDYSLNYSWDSLSSNLCQCKLF